MDDLARKLLERLLDAGNKSVAGVRSRQPALTGAALDPYHALRSFKDKESFETSVLAAKQAGAVEILVDKVNPKDGYFQRINLLDIQALSRFLGQKPYADRLNIAIDCLQEWTTRFPVLVDVFQKWHLMAKVRGSGPDDVQDWLDAARVVTSYEKRTVICVDDVPIREASAKLFQDSKRIEKLTPVLDILLSGSLDATARNSPEVWNELGLFREEQPVLMAGYVTIMRQRITALLDAPYSGFPASTVLRMIAPPSEVLTIENLTTFHSEARRRCQENILLIYTAGMPSPSWQSMYLRLLESIPNTVSVYHWGDVDEGGFRISAKLAKVASLAGHKLLPWKMDPGGVPTNCRRTASPKTIDRMSHYAEATGWPELSEAIARFGIMVEQEAL